MNGDPYMWQMIGNFIAFLLLHPLAALVLLVFVLSGLAFISFGGIRFCRRVKN